MRFRIIVFVIDIAFIIILCKRFLSSIKNLKHELEAFLKENYISDLFMIVKRKKLIHEFLGTILFVPAALLIFEIIRFKLCLPPSNFIEDGFNLNLLKNILDFYIQPCTGISALEYLDGLNSFSNLSFGISIPAGFVFVHCIGSIKNNVN